MTVEQVVDLVLTLLDECGIPYMVAGSWASNVHGMPRATYDADVVVELDRESLNVLVDAVDDQFYVSREAAVDALHRRGMFNLVHLDSGFKIDLIVRKSRPYSREEFARRRKSPLAGRDRWLASPEDVVLTKLEWSRAGESERQYRDALDVARVQGAALDGDYLRRWASDLALGDLLERFFRDLEQGS